ncbi:MAG: YitT family protein, partial [Clostridia bacterium]
MKETTKIALKKELHSIKWTNFIFLTLSGLVNATGVTLFLTPVNLVDGGFSGTSFVISALSNGYITLSLALVVLNFPFFIFGAKKLGLQFVIYSLYAIAMYSLFAYLYQHVLPIDFTNGAPLTGSDLLLASIFGGLISGMGSGLTIRFGGALDGVEVMAVVFSKKLNLTVGTFVMGYNLILFTITGIVF